MELKQSVDSGNLKIVANRFVDVHQLQVAAFLPELVAAIEEDPDPVAVNRLHVIHVQKQVGMVRQVRLERFAERCVVVKCKVPSGNAKNGDVVSRLNENKHPAPQ